MVETLFRFNHDCNEIPQAMGFTKEIDKKCIEMIHFCTFTTYFIAKELYTDIDDVPNNLTTSTGILERAFTLCSNEDEKIYLVYIFKEIYENCRNMMFAYKAYYEENDENLRNKMKALMDLTEISATLKDNRSEITTPKDMFKKINIAKENMYNFEKYYEQAV